MEPPLLPTAASPPRRLLSQPQPPLLLARSRGATYHAPSPAAADGSSRAAYGAAAAPARPPHRLSFSSSAAPQPQRPLLVGARLDEPFASDSDDEAQIAPLRARDGSMDRSTYIAGAALSASSSHDGPLHRSAKRPGYQHKRAASSISAGSAASSSTSPRAPSTPPSSMPLHDGSSPMHRPFTRGEAEMLDALRLGGGATSTGPHSPSSVMRRAGSSMRRASSDFKRMLASSGASGSGRRKKEGGSVDLAAPTPRYDAAMGEAAPLWTLGRGPSAEELSDQELSKPHPSWWSPSRTPSPATSAGGASVHSRPSSRRLSFISAARVQAQLNAMPVPEAEGENFEFAPTPAKPDDDDGSSRAARALRSLKRASNGALRRASFASTSSDGPLYTLPSASPTPKVILLPEEGQPSHAYASPDRTPSRGRAGSESATPRAMDNRSLLQQPDSPTDGRDSVTPTPGTTAPVLASPSPAPGSRGPLGAAAVWRRAQREASAAALERGAPVPEAAVPPSAAETAGPPARGAPSSTRTPRAAAKSSADSSAGEGGRAGQGGDMVGVGAGGGAGGPRGWGTRGANNGGGGDAAGGGQNGGAGGGRGPPNGRSGAPTATSGSASQQMHSLFRRQELVGRGAYGAVYRGVHVPTGGAVALKVVNLDTPEDDVSDIQKEVATLSQLRDAESKNIVRYWGCWLIKTELWIVMDFAEGGSVRTVMKAGPLSERFCGLVVRESLVALAYLHKSGIIHRDIKAANILLTTQGRVLLCDFGVAASLVSSSVHAKRSTFVGTPYWMAPEVITEGKTYDQSADIWSLGITLYEMACGNPPHAEQEQMRAIMLIPKSKPPRLPVDGNFSPLMRDFLAMCLNEEPRERPNADELAKSKWIKSFAKTPNSVLKELLNNYTAWTKSGGMRMSLLGAEAADLNDAGNRDSFMFDGRESDDGWVFNTLRDHEAYDGFDEDIVQPQPIRDHPLLRLFDAADGTPAVETLPAETTSALRRPSSPKPMPSLSTLRAADVRPAPPPPVGVAPVAAAPAPGTAEDKASFAGMGNTPFRFGGGGGDSSALGTPRAAVFNAPAASRLREHRAQPSEDSTEPTTADTSFGDTTLPHSGSTSAGTSLNGHGRHASKSSLAHRRGISNISGASDKSSAFSNAQESLPSELPQHALSASPSQMRGPRIVPLDSNAAAQAFKTAVAAGSLGRPPAPTRAATEQLGHAGEWSEPQILRARSAGPSADDGPASAPAQAERTAAQAATAALVAAQRQAAQSPSYGMRSRSGSRSRPFHAHDGALAVAPAMPGRSISAAPYTTSFRDAVAARHYDLAPPGALDLADTLPPSPSVAASAYFPATSAASSQRAAAAWGPSPLRPSAGGLGRPIVHSRLQHGGSDPTQTAGFAGGPMRADSGDASDGSGWPSVPPGQPTGPRLRALDFSNLEASGGVHAELARVVDDLGAWLDVLGMGLASAISVDAATQQ